MTAGLPGVGIGGMFYLASALLMPFRSLAFVLTGRARESRWTLALTQAAIALGMLVTVWATGWALGWLIASVAPPAAVSTATGAPAAVPVQNVVRTATLLGSVATLLLVLGVVQLLRIVLPPRPTPLLVDGQSPEAQSAA